MNLPRTITTVLQTALTLCALALSGCIEDPVPPLRIGIYQRTGFEPLSLARSLGYYDERRIQLVEFPSSAETLLAYRNHSIDAATVTTDDVLRLAAEGQAIRVALVMAYSKGTDTVLAKPEAGGIAGLKGRKIAVESNSLGGYLLGRALETAGLGFADVQIVSARVDRVNVDVVLGNVDGAVSFDPHRARIMRRGVQPIFDSTQLSGEIADVLIVPAALAEEPPAALRELAAGWFRALDYHATNAEDAVARMAPREGCTPAQFRDALALVEFVDLAENHRQLGAPASPLAGRMLQMMNFMTRAGMLPHEVDPGSLRSDRLLPPLPR